MQVIVNKEEYKRLKSKAADAEYLRQERDRLSEKMLELREENREFEKENAQLVRQNDMQQNTIADLSSAISVLCDGKVTDAIELFVLKTYRGQTQLYINGNKMNVDRSNDVCIRWGSSDPVSVDIDDVR